MLPGNSLRQTVDINRASVHQAAKLVTALLRVARVTAGLVENNGSLPSAGFMTHVTCRLTAKNRDQLRNPRLGTRVWATFTFHGAIGLKWFTECADSDAGKQALPAKDDGCIIDRLLSEIRQGTSLRRAGTRHSRRSPAPSTTTLPTSSS